ncbi:hypothetical protein HU200_003463 [Digitaria exilis]|uniref:F-box domain-containing protein n=1 Tax=Digitaria exilis TaxID=1010633 RepID=A0A835FX92_9POAL|nr:hypothetical protein HU200_003463 [Digitaria exilis]
MMKGRRSKRRRSPAASFTDDLIIEILSRLPARSVCRFRCVSKTWQNLISSHHRKLHQTLAGFFTMHDGERGGSVSRFTNVISGRGCPAWVSSSFDFLPNRGYLQDCCNGLVLLCNYWWHSENPDGVSGPFALRQFGEVVRLVVYVLEDDDSQQWTLKHEAEAFFVLRQWSSNIAREFEWVTIHPDCNMIFYTVGWDKTLMSYDMDHRRVQVFGELGQDTRERYLPYVPLFSESEGLHS